MDDQGLAHQVTDTSWMAQARCHDLPPEIFFPSDGAGVEVARHYCAECAVRRECLEYALANAIEHGVWGGESERSRRRMTRDRRLMRALARSAPRQ